MKDSIQNTDILERKKDTRRKLFYLTVLCVLVGSIVRILYCWKYPVPVRDSYEYLFFLEEWIGTGRIPTEDALPPLAMFLLKIPTTCLGFDLLNGGIILNVVLGLLIIITLIRLSYFIFPSTTFAFVTGLLAATHPTLVRYSCQMTRENSFLLFCSLGVLAIIKFLKGSRLHIVTAAFFGTAAFLCRHEGVELFLIFGTIILFAPRIKMRAKAMLFTSFILISMISFLTISYAVGVPGNYYNAYLSKYNSYLNPEVDED